jgi:peptide/nickel transport system ATP-binding protein
MVSNEPLLRVDGLRTKFDLEDRTVHAVNGVSFDIQEGEILGLAGESGSGKSVTALSILQLLSDQATIDAKSIQYKGEELTNKSEKEMNEFRGSEISMIFQDPMSSLNPVMTVGEQIAEVVRHKGGIQESSSLGSELVRKYITGTSVESESWKRAVELMEKVEIPNAEERAGNYPHQLSGGMIQRIMIAQALAGNPSLLIADEPTTALDVSVEAQILNEILDLRDELQLSVLFITHDLGVIKEICDNTAIMYGGKLMEHGSTDEIFDNPRHPYTNGLLSSIPRIDEHRKSLETIEGEVPTDLGNITGCPFADRCEYAFEMCDQPLQKYKVKDNHTSHCHLLNENTEKGISQLDNL